MNRRDLFKAVGACSLGSVVPVCDVALEASASCFVYEIFDVVAHGMAAYWKMLRDDGLIVMDRDIDPARLRDEMIAEFEEGTR